MYVKYKNRRKTMAYQMTFKRYELKYLLNRQEKEQILLAMEPCKAVMLEKPR